jgi:hypothetical protein
MTIGGVAQSVQRLGCSLDNWGSVMRGAMMGFFFSFATSSRLALGPTWPPIEEYQGLVPWQ